jgi:hypothetical protein
MTMRFNLGYKFTHLSGYEMLRKTEPLHPPNGGCKIKPFRYPILFSGTPNCAISYVFPEIAGGSRPRVVRSKPMVLERLHVRSLDFLSSRRRSVHRHRRRPGIRRASLTENRPEVSL